MENVKKRNGVLVILVIVLFLVCMGLCSFAGYEYANYNKEESYDDVKTDTTLDNSKKSFYVDIYRECDAKGGKSCNLEYNETVNNKKYNIVIKKEETIVDGVTSNIESIKINDIEEDFVDIAYLSAVAILENGLVAIRITPFYVGSSVTSYYDDKGLVDTISNIAYDDYDITKNYGVYFDCDAKSADDSDYSDFNQTLIIKQFEINDNNKFIKKEIGRVENTFCTVQD
ncbi:MAG: hypothetical protein ACI4XM_07580 [Candidatus Coprovivens sp.]